jgi:hypothetical protein
VCSKITGLWFNVIDKSICPQVMVKGTLKDCLMNTNLSVAEKAVGTETGPFV